MGWLSVARMSKRRWATVGEAGREPGGSVSTMRKGSPPVCQSSVSIQNVESAVMMRSAHTARPRAKTENGEAREGGRARSGKERRDPAGRPREAGSQTVPHMREHLSAAQNMVEMAGICSKCAYMSLAVDGQRLHRS